MTQVQVPNLSPLKYCGKNIHVPTVNSVGSAASQNALCAAPLQLPKAGKVKRRKNTNPCFLNSDYPETADNRG